MENYSIVNRSETPSFSCEATLLKGVNEEAQKAKGLSPMRTFCLSLESREGNIFGGINGALFYGCLYVDMLWVSQELRNKGWGTKLMKRAETLAKNKGNTFATVNTMDWEALPFYQKLGYQVEFVREGFQKDSKMYFLRKSL